MGTKEEVRVLKNRLCFGYALVSLGVLMALLLALPIAAADSPRQRVMGLFQLSFVLVLLLTYLLGAAGRLMGLAASQSPPTWRKGWQELGYPLFQRHIWADCGRLYALVFLVFVGALVAAGLETYLHLRFVGFEQRIALSNDGTGLTETDALQKIARDQLPLTPADGARFAQVMAVTNLVYASFAASLLVFLTRLIPYFFWRSGGPAAPTLAQAWRRGSWRLSLGFGLSLWAGLGGLLLIASPLWLRLVLAAGLFAVWALVYARFVCLSRL